MDVVAVVHDGVQGLDLCGPVETFGGANAVLGRQEYDLHTCAADPVVRTEAGLRIGTDQLPACTYEGLVLVPGGRVAIIGSPGSEQVTDWLAATVPTRLATVCTGAFLAARAGLLDGRRVTTHWSEAGRLAEEHPKVRVAARELYVHDGPVWSSGGVTAGIDMALAIIANDHGYDVARTVARWLVMYLHRPGWQDQYAGPIWHPAATDARIHQIRREIEAAPSGDHTLAAVAHRVGLSPRHLQRLFAAQVGTPLATFVTASRLQAAQHALIGSDAPLSVIARTTGFGSTESLRRAFHKHLGISPHEFRARFSTTNERPAW